MLNFQIIISSDSELADGLVYKLEVGIYVRSKQNIDGIKAVKWLMYEGGSWYMRIAEVDYVAMI